jgi:hypothetical protein
MAISVSEKVVFATAGRQTLVMGKITMDSSYPTNGEAVTAADFGFKRLNHVLCGASETGYVFAFDDSASKIKAFEAGADGAALDEVANTTDLSASHFVFLASGIGRMKSDI